MFTKNLLMAPLLLALSLPLMGQTIALDSLSGSGSVLTTGAREQTLPDYIGRNPSWGVRKAQGDEAKWIAATFDPALTPFKDGAAGSMITEMSPQGADKNPALRKFNLPDLLDQLQLEGTLPAGIEKVSSSETGLTIFITKPTAISVSFSTYRPIRIVNKSYLVLICPACDTVSLENDADSAVIDFYSFKCIAEPYGGKFNRYVFVANAKAWLAPCAGGTYDNISLEKIPLEPRSWLPQLYVSLHLGRSPDELLKMWNPLYNTTLSLK